MAPYLISQMMFTIKNHFFYRPADKGTEAVVKLVFNETVPIEEIPTPSAVVQTLTSAVLNGSAGNITFDVGSIQILGMFTKSFDL